MALPAKKILFLFTRPPYPANDGTKIKILSNILDAVRGTYDCTIAIISDVPPDADAVAYLQKNYGKVKYFYQSRLRRAWAGAWGWLCGYPLQTGFFYSGATAGSLRKDFEDADVIYAHTLRFGKYIEQLPLEVQKKVLLDFNDAISFNYHIARKHARGLWKYVYAAEEGRVRRYEKKLLSHPYHFSIICTADRDYLLLMNRDTPITVIEHGVADELLVYPNDHSGNHNAVFLGNIFYPPNLDGVVWLCKFFEDHRGDFKDIAGSLLDVAGRTPHGLRKNIPRISFAGFVDDADDFITSHKIFVAPLRFGAGVQTKVLEAMALGMPVITSPIGARGVSGVKHGENIFIIDTADEASWLQTITALLHDPALRSRVGNAARALIRERHTASRARAKFRALIDAIAPPVS